MSTTTNIDTATQGDEKHTIATYLSDLLALERHMAAPVESQVTSDDHQQYPAAAAIFQKIKTITDAHIAALDAQLNAVGGHPASGIKSAWSQLLGGGAATLNAARKPKVSKSLRDDYTALGLSSISYTMFHATALGLGDTASAQLAKRHLDDITPIIVAISEVIPGVVLGELAADGENVQVTAAQLTQQATKDSWSNSNTGKQN
jgi:ferritin-like metal-binding protein YciE